MAVVFKSVLWFSSCLWLMSKEPVGLNSVYKPNYSFSAFPTCISHKKKSAILKPVRTWSWSRPGLLLALPLYPQLSTFSALFGQLSLVISLPIFWNFVGIAYYLHFPSPCRLPHTLTNPLTFVWFQRKVYWIYLGSIVISFPLTMEEKWNLLWDDLGMRLTSLFPWLQTCNATTTTKHFQELCDAAVNTTVFTFHPSHHSFFHSFVHPSNNPFITIFSFICVLS